MRLVSAAMRDQINDQLRKVSIAIDEAGRGLLLRKGDMNFELALGAVRGWRRAIEQTPDVETVIRSLKEMVLDLSNIGGSAQAAVERAMQMTEDLAEWLEPQAA